MEKLYLCAYLYGAEKYVCILRKEYTERSSAADAFILVLDTYLQKYPKELVVVLFDENEKIIVTWPLETPCALRPMIQRALLLFKEGETLEENDFLLRNVVGSEEYDHIKAFPESYVEKATDNLGKYCDRIEEVS